MNDIITKWLKINHINYEVIDPEIDCFCIGDEMYHFTSSPIIGLDFIASISLKLVELLKEIGVDYICFLFGDTVYYTHIESETIQLNPLTNCDVIEDKFKFTIPQLGVHGSYEIHNGTTDYKNWCKAAHFYKIKTLGICEHHTLGGTLPFQLACLKNNIKPIIGWSGILSINGGKSTFKVYAINKKGWKEILDLNKKINVDHLDKIDLEYLNNVKNCVIVLDVECIDYLRKKDILKLKSVNKYVYYQFSFVTYHNQEVDKANLLRLQKYLDKYQSILDPIIIDDKFVPYSYNSGVKKIVNLIASNQRQPTFTEMGFESTSNYIARLKKLTKSNKQAEKLFIRLLKNTNNVASRCKFTIETDKLRLPKYKYNDSKDSKYQLDTLSKDKMQDLVIIGLKKLNLNASELKIYQQRIKKEYSVIRRGGFIDYFLILHDIVEWCEEKDILTGVGRGSAGGCLISYLLGITKVDPIKYNLLFERFLNESRIKESLPDIDVDFMGSRRDEVKSYMEERYGQNNVCVVGTYQTYQIKAALQDLGRINNVNASDRNYVTTMVDKVEGFDDYSQLFINAQQKPKIREFIENNSTYISSIPHLLNQPKSRGVHACATLIVPDKDDDQNDIDIFGWLPVRKLEGGMLVSEWEGQYVENAGFLKEDILGIKQLDKFSSIINYIRANHSKNIKIDNIPLDDPHVYNLYKKGYNKDNFHFGSDGLSKYSKQVKPDNINDLIAMIALYRPGAMKSNAHNDYISYKFGKKQPIYDYKLKEVTKETYSLYIYQEQVMEACRVLGGFSLSEADGVRKAMGKKIKSKMDGYKIQFIDNAVNVEGCSEKEAIEIWTKLEVFSGYGFNKSHATAYALTGYYCQWFKYHYPIEYWTTAFEFADSNDSIDRYIDEINQVYDNIDVSPPNINYSGTTFYSKDNTIYWSLNSVKFVGDSCSEFIINERNINGKFFSLQEFCDRIEKRKVNKRAIEYLILSGAFDEMYNIKNVTQRRVIFKDLDELYKIKKDKSLNNKYSGLKEYEIILLQKQSCGLGYINFKELITNSKKYMPAEDILDEESVGKLVATNGILNSVIVRNSKNGSFATLQLQVNTKQLTITVWNETWTQYEDLIKSNKGQIMELVGSVRYDKFRGYNVIHSTQYTTISFLNQ